MQQQAPTNNNQMRTAAIVTIVVIVGLLLLGRFVTGMSGNTTPTTSDTTYNGGSTTNNNPVNPNNNTLNPSNNTTNNTGVNTLGPVVAAQAVDRDNCAVDATTRFATNQPVYVVLADSKLPKGTTMFARLYKDGVAVEDTKELTAQSDYNNVCVNFVFKPSQSAQVWTAGSYEAEFFVNGNSYRSTSFDIR